MKTNSTCQTRVCHLVLQYGSTHLLLMSAVLLIYQDWVLFYNSICIRLTMLLHPALHGSCTIKILCLQLPVLWIEFIIFLVTENTAQTSFAMFFEQTHKESLCCKSIPTHVRIGTTANKTHATYITPPLLENYKSCVLCLIISSVTDVMTFHSQMARRYFCPQKKNPAPNPLHCKYSPWCPWNDNTTCGTGSLYD